MLSDWSRINNQSLLLANDDSPVKTDVAIAFHPSFLVEADLKNINSIPVGIFAGEEDDMLSVDQLNKVCDFSSSFLFSLSSLSAGREQEMIRKE